MKTILINISDPKQKGFSLVSMMVATGLLSALTLGFMEFMRGSLKGQQKLMEVREVGDLKNEMGILLDSENHCRNSLAGSGEFEQPDPDKGLVFRKTAIDTEGSKELELWTSDQVGNARAEKMFYAGKEYGTLTIESIKLFMDGATEGDYEPSDGHEDIGTLKVVTKTLDDTEQNFDIKLSVFMQTDDQGESTLLSCSRESSARRCGDNQKWTPNCGCVPEGEAHTRAMAGINDESFTCRSLTCNPQERWHAQCGCISLAEYESIEQNPDQENPCQQQNVTFFEYLPQGETTLGPYKFCAIAQVHQNNPCSSSGPRNNCQVTYINGTWKGIKAGAPVNEDECHALGCSVVCWGGDGCAPPKKMVNGECTSCDPPNQWYRHVCANCESGRYSYRHNKCIPDCRDEASHFRCPTWNDFSGECAENCPLSDGGR